MSLMMYRQALNQALREEMDRDPGVFVVGEEVGQYEGTYRVTEKLLAEFGPERILDTPISEEAIVGLGIGAAMVGLRPVVELMTINFALLAMDQIVNHAAKILYMSNGQFSVPMVIRMPEGSGMQLGAQHSQHFAAWFAHVPGLKVVCPSTPYDAKGLLKSAIRDNNPVVFIESQLLYSTKGDVPESDYTVPIGRAEVRRTGSDLTIYCLLHTVGMSMNAAKKLESEDISVEVVDLRTLRPLDVDAIVSSLKKTHRAIVVEECWPQYGIGAQIADCLQANAFDYLDGPVLRVAQADVPMPYSKNLERSALPSEEKIIAAARAALAGIETPEAIAISI